ncbi:MAG: dynamin family protein [Chloroflexi bacterium]|nr:dynamin family protein [Chloroflexota bacterium]
MHILNERQEALLKDERAMLNELRAVLLRFGATAEDDETLGRSIRQLDELFMLVVVGEFNAGKSALINALLGQRLLKEGVTPTTTRINVLRYGQNAEHQVVDEHQHILLFPVEMLSEISIVDTPGTNAIIRAHEVITAQFVPRSDLVLFVTSADRPFTESERAFLERIRDWGKKVVIVINKIDILQNDQELQEIEAFVLESARSLLGIHPHVFPVSARLALRAKQGEPSYWAESRFGALEQYIRDTLDESERLRLKLLNPLGVGTHLLGRYLGEVASRLDLLKADLDMLADVDAQLALYKEDMRREFALRLSDAEKVLFEMEQRGDDYLDETFRPARFLDLLNKDRIQREFALRVVDNAPQEIERRVNELIDWMVNADLRQWRAVTEHLAERRRAHQERIVGGAMVDGFHYDRERLMESVGREAQRVVESYDKAQEAEIIAEGARLAVAVSAAVEVGAIGLGTAITILATTLAADVTGVVLAGSVAILGLFIIPARRRRAKAALGAKVSALRESLLRALRTHFEREIERSVQRIYEAVAPYTRFVRAEHGKLLERQRELQQLKGELDRLRGRVMEI